MNRRAVLAALAVATSTTGCLEFRRSNDDDRRSEQGAGREATDTTTATPDRSASPVAGASTTPTTTETGTETETETVTTSNAPDTIADGLPEPSWSLSTSDFQRMWSRDGSFYLIDGGLRKVSPSGSEQWSTQPLRETYSVRESAFDVDGDLVVVAESGGGGSGEENPGRVAAYDRETGESLWTFDFPDGINHKLGGPLTIVPDGPVMATTFRGRQIAAEDPYLFALDRSTGEVSWKKDLPQGFIFSNSVHEGWVFLTMYGVPSKLLAFGGPRGGQSIEQDLDHNPAGMTIGDGIGYVSSVNTRGMLRAVELPEMNSMWKRSIGAEAVGPPTVGDDAVFTLTRSNSVVANDRATGRESWRSETSALSTTRSPHYWKGHVLVSDRSSSLHAFDAASGETVLQKSSQGNRLLFETHEDTLLVCHPGRVVAYTYD